MHSWHVFLYAFSNFDKWYTAAKCFWPLTASVEHVKKITFLRAGYCGDRVSLALHWMPNEQTSIPTMTPWRLRQVSGSGRPLDMVSLPIWSTTSPRKRTSRGVEPKLSILTLGASSWKTLLRDHSGGLRVGTSWPTKVMFICRPLIWISSASAATGPTLFCVSWRWTKRTSSQKDLPSRDWFIPTIEPFLASSLVEFLIFTVDGEGGIARKAGCCE